MTSTLSDLQAGGDELPAGSLLVTPEQLCQWLQVSRRSLYRMREERALPAPVRLRHSVRWRAADIAAWLAAGCPSQPIAKNG